MLLRDLSALRNVFDPHVEGLESVEGVNMPSSEALELVPSECVIGCWHGSQCSHPTLSPIPPSPVVARKVGAEGPAGMRQ
jgi:hypothetical protein